MRRSFKMLIRKGSKSPGEFKNDIRDLKEKIEVLDQERYHGALAGARAVKFAVGESLTKKALGIEKSYARINTISEIEKEGKIMRDQADIEQVFFLYYSKLFAHNPVKVTEFMNEFLVLLPKLNEENKAFLEMPITVNEIVKR